MAFSSNRNSPELVSEFGIEMHEVRADLRNHADTASQPKQRTQGVTTKSKLLRVETHENIGYLIERVLMHEKRLGSFKNPKN
jgi:hypothetical protein